MASPSDVLCGTCEDMCPSAERRMRLANGLIHALEMDEPWVTASNGLPAIALSSNRPNQRGSRRPPARRVNEVRMVKEYARSAADKRIDATDVRSFSALRRTVEYLLDKIAGTVLMYNAGNDCEMLAGRWPVVYAFVSDRLRAVRQDAIVQQLPVNEMMTLLELMLPFYIVAPFTTDGTPIHHPDRNQMCRFDSKLHAEELEECFLTWRKATEDCGGGAEELHAAYLLRSADYVETFVRCIERRNEFESASLADDVIAAVLAYRMNNFVAFFRSYYGFETLLRCTMASFVVEMRECSLIAISAAYRAPNVRIPMQVLAKWMAFETTSDLYSCLKDLFYNLDISDGGDAGDQIKFQGAQLKSAADRMKRRRDGHWFRMKRLSHGGQQTSIFREIHGCGIRKNVLKS